MNKSLVIWRMFLFLFFAALAAPLEYHVKWIAPWTRGMVAFEQAVNDPLVHGSLFFYSVIVAIEALFRIEMHPGRAERPAAKFLKGCCYISLIPVLVFLIRGLDAPLTGGWITFQWYLAIACLLLSLVVFLYFQKADKIVSQMQSSRA